MGGKSSKLPKVQFDNFGEEYFFGQMSIHNVLTRGMDAVIAAAEKAETPAQYEATQRYAAMLFDMIELHHHDEDDIIFPYVETKQASLTAPMTQEHKEMMDDLHQLEAATKKQPTKETMEELSTIVKRLKAFLVPHFEKENQALNANWWVQSSNKKEADAVHNRLMKHVKKQPPERVLVFFVYHATMEERSVIKLPGFVRSMLFPKWAKKYADVWELAPHATKNAKGKLVFA